MVNPQRSLATVMMTVWGIKAILFVQNFPGVQRYPVTQDEVKGLHPTSHGSHSEDFLYLSFSPPLCLPLSLSSLLPMSPAMLLWRAHYSECVEIEGKTGKVSEWFFVLNLEWNLAIFLSRSQLVYLSKANSSTPSLMYGYTCFLGDSLPWLIFSFHFNMAEGRQSENQTWKVIFLPDYGMWLAEQDWSPWWCLLWSPAILMNSYSLAIREANQQSSQMNSGAAEAEGAMGLPPAHCSHSQLIGGTTNLQAGTGLKMRKPGTRAQGKSTFLWEEPLLPVLLPVQVCLKGFVLTELGEKASAGSPTQGILLDWESSFSGFEAVTEAAKHR